MWNDGIEAHRTVNMWTTVPCSLKLKKECRIGDMSLNRLRFNSESELRIALLSRQGHRNQPMKNDYNPVHIHYTRFLDFNGMGTLQSTNLAYGGLTH